MRPFLALCAVAVIAAPPALAQQRPPVEQGAKNAPWQEPAFPGQTRAPQSDTAPRVAVEPVAEGLPQLWGMEFLPDGAMLVTAKAGAMHIVSPAGVAGPAIANVPAVDARRQGGLLDVALSPNFAQDGLVYASFSEPRGGGENGTSVFRARLVRDGDGGALEDVTVILRQTPSYAGTMHYGSRLAFAPDGTLFVTTGERSRQPIRDQSQDTASGLGKIFRINPDGSVPKDNPFVGAAPAQPAIWSYGHRNLQSAVVTEAGELWTVEHGPRGGDELNKPEAGKNYGWPVITYGINYGGSRVGEGITRRDGMEQPVYYWDPVIAPSGMAEYTSDRIAQWRGALLVGGLVAQALVVLKHDGERVVTEDHVPLGARIRDVKVGPDGAVYAITEQRGGPSGIVRVVPADAS
ncbi:MAG: PQQ-dependent sugar dehydrogenase [Acuticoccus sp.]